MSAKGQTISEALGIVHRPEDVAGRKLPGQWEGDFIKGAYNRSGVGSGHSIPAFAGMMR